MTSNPFDAIRKSFIDRLDDDPSRSFSIQAGALIGLSILVASLSLTVFARCARRTARMWTIEDNGIFHFNVSVVVQMLSGIYAVCKSPRALVQIVSLSGYLTKHYSEPNRLAIQLASPLILYLALLVVVHSLAVEPLFNPLLRPFPSIATSLGDEWDISHALKRRHVRRRSTKINGVSVCAILVLLVAPLTATIALVHEWNRLDRILQESVEWADGVEASRSPLSSITLGRFTARGLEQEKRVVATTRLWSAFWIAMLVVCALILVLAFAYFLTTLRQRRAALRRALSRLSSNGRGRFEPGPFDDAASKTGSEAGTLAHDKQQELRERFVATEKVIKRVYLRFFLVAPVVASYAALHAWTIRHFYPHSPSLFTLTLWSSWTFTPLALASSLIFAFRTLFGHLPKLDPSQTPYPFSPRHRSYPGGGGGARGDTASERHLRSSASSTFAADTRSTASRSSTYASSVHSSRGPSLSPPYALVDVYRPRHVDSYPPRPVDPSPAADRAGSELARKKSLPTPLDSRARKPVPSDDGDEDQGQLAGGGDELDSTGSQHGSVWKEQLLK
ncbi:hypothetical protein JCM11491_006970 [Sporobolomyces phaffii]